MIGPRGNTIRALLLNIGIGDFNVIMITQYMFMAPSTTDPSMQGIMLLTKAIQEQLIGMGASIQATGVLDKNTARLLRMLSGRAFLTLPWYQIVKDVISARDRGMTFATDSSYGGDVGPAPSDSLSGVLDSVPGGAIGLGVGVAALWYFFGKRSA